MVFEVFTEFQFTFLNLLSVLAFFTTVGLFFCGIPICRQIWKRKDTNEISGAPFLMGVVGGSCWLTYGYLKNDHTVMYVTGTQVFLYSSYTVFYFIMTQKKFWISVKIAVVIALCSTLFALTHFFGHKVFHPLGIICMTLNTADFGAPLAGLRVVIRRRATSTLPLPLCIANFLVSSEWFVYGLLVNDWYLITPNGIGSVLAVSQLILFTVLPRKPNQRAPILRLFDCVRGKGSDKVQDIEADAVVPEEKDEEGKINEHRWSKRVIANVAGEIENVMQKCHIHDQFAYSDTLNNVDEVSNKSLSLSTEASVDQSVEDETVKTATTDIVTPSSAKLKQLSRQLSSKLNPHSRKGSEEDAQGLKRCMSAPNLRE
uniref:Sugar transporter SWEET1 n=1 Tax=Steinernema glaseri TaxID=37863 RepID=A0A1I8ABJ6_9BILA